MSVQLKREQPPVSSADLKGRRERERLKKEGERKKNKMRPVVE